ncbi:MAG: HAD family hydrolase [Flavobacteriales bacterium]
MKNFDPSVIDSSWTLFLDRDGVINKRIVDDYVKHYHEFEFLDGVLEALKLLNPVFDRIVVVTNQQGIGKGVMTERDLLAIHEHMLAEVFTEGGRIDAIFHCPELAENDPACRKPNTGMAIEAREQFPEIDFSKSIMVGDSDSDMEFGERLGMRCAFIGENSAYEPFPALIHFAKRITSE